LLGVGLSEEQLMSGAEVESRIKEQIELMSAGVEEHA
jgi:hypothetical protein